MLNLLIYFLNYLGTMFYEISNRKMNGNDDMWILLSIIYYWTY